MSSDARKPESDDQNVCLESTVLPLTTTAQRDLIRVLALVLRRRIDPVPLVHSLSLEYRGADRRRLERFAQTMHAGVPVMEALRITPGLFDRHVVAALQLSNDASQLPQMFDALLKGNPEGSDAVAHSSGPSEFARLSLTVLVFALVLTFIMIFIVPTFAKLFEEFGLTLPAPTLLLIYASELLAGYWFLLALVILIVVAIRADAIARFFGNRLNPQASGFLPASSPAAIRSLLAVAAQSGRPMAEELKTIGNTLNSARMRRRITRAGERVERGQGVWQALAIEKIISRKEAVALAESASGPTQAWLLGYSASARQSRRHSLGQATVRGIAAFLTIVIGFCVAFIVISLFMPLVELISGLT